jgi:tripartite-type tricarboxylate transporter receptor subunit TctC
MKTHIRKYKELEGRIIILILISCLLALPTNFVFAADYPDRSINFLIPYGSGGITDITGRALVSAANKHIRQQIVPINRPGGAGAVAAMAVAASKPDGYTLGLCTASQMMMSPHDPDNPLKNLDGFTFIMNFGGNLVGFITRSDAPWKTWSEFIAAARREPGKLKIGLTGAPYNNYAGLLLAQVANREKVKFALVPFKSGAEILTATMGGHIDLYGTAIDTPTVSFVKQGKAIPLAMADIKFEGFEKIPLLVDHYNLSRDIDPHLAGVYGPKGIPEQIVVFIEDLFTKAAKDPDFLKVLNQSYVPQKYMNRVEMNAYVQRTFISTGEAIKKVRDEIEAEKKQLR